MHHKETNVPIEIREAYARYRAIYHERAGEMEWRSVQGTLEESRLVMYLAEINDARSQFTEAIKSYSIENKR